MADLIGAASIHWAALVTAGCACLGVLSGLLAWLVASVRRWRQEDRTRQAQVATLLADWLDEVDDHLEDQDDRLARTDWRVAKLEQTAGLPSAPPAAPLRRRNRSRRVDIAERGLRATDGPSDAPGGIDAQ